jgi:hypothetical protein
MQKTHLAKLKNSKASPSCVAMTPGGRVNAQVRLDICTVHKSFGRIRVAESKEAIAGYIFLQVTDLNEAVEIAKECPGLEYGMSVEVRAVDERMGRAPA